MKPAPTAADREALLPWNVVRELGGDAGPRARVVDGAMLIADVSGYTRLAERLSDLGDEGLGRLSDLLNGQFGRYMAAVAAHAGEMISFAGDALLACFLNRPGLAPPHERAAACARALTTLTTLTTLTPVAEMTDDDTVVPHVGVAAGPLWFARLGGWYGRWELLAGGDAVRAAFAAAASARPGEVRFGDVRTTGSTSSMSESADDASGAAIDADWAYGLVHPRVLEAVSSTAASTAELRQIVALFVRVTGLDVGASDAVDRHQRWVFAVHETLRTISSGSGRFLVDDKGLVFVLVLGDPGNAHTNDVERALSFASELAAHASDLGLGIQMGLASGRAFCGVIGDAHRRQYAIVGPAMNTAARLMDASAGGLLAALPASDDRLRDFRITPAGTLMLKGVREPIAAVRVDRASAAVHAPRGDELLGRGLETRQLDQLLEAAKRGHGGGAVIVGEAGIGKSTLARWLVARAEMSGVRCLVGEADLTEAASPYFAFRPILRAIIGGDSRDGVDSLRGRLATALARHGRAEFAPLFNAVLPLQLPETPTTESLRGQTRADVLVDLLIELVREASTRPLAMLIEDAHWMDSATAQLLERIRTRLDRPLIVLTARPEADDDVLQSLERLPAVLRLELGPLGAESIAGLAHAAFGGPVAPSVVAQVHEQTRGNPFFVKEYLRALRETDTPGVSPTLQGLIASRIDGLPAEPRHALKVASVLGQQVDLGILGAVLAHERGSSATGIDSLVSTLERRRLIVRDDANDRAVRFAHALIQTVAYDSLVFDRRTILHRAAAEAIERQASPGEGHHVLLVHHWSRARDAAKTVMHAEAAADEAIRAGAYREARAFAELCVQQAAANASVSTRARQIRWQVTLADAANGLGDVRRRGTHATQALTLAGRRIPRTGSSALLHGGSALVGRGVRRRVRRDGAARNVARDPVFEYVARAYRQMAQVSFFENDPFRYVCFAAQSMVYAERAGQTAELSGALAELGGVFGYAGFERVSRSYFDEAFTLAREIGDAGAAAHVNMVHGLYSVGRGYWTDGMASVERCQALCTSIGDRVEWANAQVIRSWHHYYQGQIAEAERAARALEASARDCGNAQQMSWGLHSRGLCRLADGDVVVARDILARSVELVLDGTDPTALLSTQGSLALAHVLAGDDASGRELAARTLDAVSAISRPMGHAMTAGLSHMAEVLMRLHERERTPRTEADARAALGLLRRQASVFPIAAPSYRYWQGRFTSLHGRDPRPSLRRGLEIATALGMPADAHRIADALAH